MFDLIDMSPRNWIDISQFRANFAILNVLFSILFFNIPSSFFIMVFFYLCSH